MTGVVDQEGGRSVRVVVGVDTHQDKHVAVAIDRQGVRLGELHAPATMHGYQDLERWSRSLGEIHAFGIEGTGSYGGSRPVKWCKSASSCCCCLGGCRLREIGLRKSFVEGQNGGCEVSTSDDPFVVLLSQDGANEASHGRPVREDAHHIGASPDLLVETLLWVVGPELLPVGEWEAGEGQDVGSRFVQQRGDLGEPIVELRGHPVELGVYLIGGRVAGRWCGPWWPPRAGRAWGPE